MDDRDNARLVTMMWETQAHTLYVYCLSPHLSRDIAMDYRDDARLVTMLWETQVHTRQHSDQLAELAALLL
ncbi:putative 85 kDa calcium-independent phospholipase a2 [Operophtera brumata]|uniref:Putative 85 kDa calcium-independent phospholipase a2 n=1 Tax=Operophtera brumata TaxID=104452 RepID=A0A0L7LDT8_OPEBR|nr:putative 85 kDa calcium-independent phospholipase a2 [Operophtera brumata]